VHLTSCDPSLPVQFVALVMNNATFSVVSNVYGFAFGVLSLLGCAIGMCRSHLPSRRIQALEDLLEQTQDLFHSAVEAGLLPDHGFRTRTEARLERSVFVLS